MYSRCKPAQDASNEYVEACRAQFLDEGKHFVVSTSDDRYWQDWTRREYASVTNNVILGEMNRKLREPTTLLFFEGAVFEATINYSGTKRQEGYSQSQVLVMVEVPSEEDIR